MIRADLRWPLAVAGVVFVLLQLRITETPVAPYGWDSAEYIEHTVRLEYLAFLRSPDVMGPGEVIRKLDSNFPPLLHIMTTPLAALGAHSAEAAARVSTLWLFLLALAVAAVGERLGGRRVGLAAATGVLLLPSLQGYASRYYYDIPMTALLWGMVALALHTWPRRPWTGGVGSGLLWLAASLTKWTALPFGAAMLTGALLALPRRRPTGRPSRRQLTRAALGVGAATVTLGALLALFLTAIGEGSSLQVMLGQMWSQFGEDAPAAGGAASPITELLLAAQSFAGESSTPKLAFYTLSLATSIFSPMLALAAALLGLRWLLWCRRGLGLFVATTAGQAGFLLVLVPVADERFLVTMAPCFVLAAALGFASLPRFWRRGSAALILSCALLVALEFHLGLPTLPLSYAIDGESEPTHLGLTVPERADGWRPRPLLRSDDGLIPTVTLRGLAGTGSIDDRGWVPRRDQLIWNEEEADTAWGIIGGLRREALWIGPARGRSEAGVLGSWWISYRSLIAGEKPALSLTGCRAAEGALRALTAFPEGSEPETDPCMGATQDWELVRKFSDPRGSDHIALWRRRSAAE